MAEVIVSHVWADGSSTQVIIKAKVYPDSLETTEDIAAQCVETFVATMAELIDTEVDVELEAD
jgi:hypothetical protein